MKWPFIPIFSSGPDHHEDSCCPADDSSLQLLHSSQQHFSSQELGGDGSSCGDKDDEEDDIRQSTMAFIYIILVEPLTFYSSNTGDWWHHQVSKWNSELIISCSSFCRAGVFPSVVSRGRGDFHHVLVLNSHHAAVTWHNDTGSGHPPKWSQPRGRRERQHNRCIRDSWKKKEN